MLYFIKDTSREAVKIGYSATPRKRFGALQTCCPNKLQILGVCPGGLEDEAAVHQQLAHLRIRGEWFRCTGELLAIVKEMCAGHRLHGRCPNCGARMKELHDNSKGTGLRCEDCDPIEGLPETLRRSHATVDGHRRFPAGGGYRIIRKKH